MIRFFRQIRRRLLDTSRISKYLLYAVGEILLVVAGILIALQVNNWNEDRQTEQAVKKVLMKLRADLSYDLDHFDKLDSMNASWKKQNDYIRNEVLSGKLEKLDSAEQFFPGRYTLVFLTIKNTTQQEMINTGLMYEVDSTLQREIDKYYELSRFETKKLNADLQDYATYLFSSERKNSLSIASRLIWFRNNLEFIDWSWLQDPGSDPYKDLEIITGWYGGLLDDYTLVLEKHREQANRTIASIDRAVDE